MGREDFVIQKDGKLTEYHGKDANVVIPDGVSAIDCFVFKDRPEITSVTFPESLTTIDRCAFEGCVGLTSIIIPDNVDVIEYLAFADCKNLKSVVFSGGVRHICGYAFERCINLRKVTFSSRGIPGISDVAFYDCPSLEEIYFSDKAEKFTGSGCEAVWNCLFYGKHKICMMVAVLRDCFDIIKDEEDIVRKLKSNKKKIIEFACRNDDAEAVVNLLSLQKNIKLDDLDEYIAISASAPAVKACLMNRKNESFSAEDQRKAEDDKIEKELGLKKRTVAEWKKIFQFENYGRRVVIKGYKGNDFVVEIPEKIGNDTVTGIWEDTFNPEAPRVTSALSEARKCITTVTIPRTVTQIFPDTFLNCSGLEGIYVDKENKFYSSDESGIWYDKEKKELIFCPNKNRTSKLVLPDTVKVIGQNALQDCKNLKSVTLGKAVTAIGEEAFRGCKNLETVTIPESVRSIGSYAFFGCEKLKSVTIPDGITEISDYMFTECKNLNSVEIPRGVKRIGSGAFSECKNLTSVTVPDSVMRIAPDAFEGCGMLTVYCTPASYAEFFAKKHYMRFEYKYED